MFKTERADRGGDGGDVGDGGGAGSRGGGRYNEDSEDWDSALGIFPVIWHVVGRVRHVDTKAVPCFSSVTRSK